MVTPWSSAIFLTRLRPAMVFLAPSSSGMPLRLPEKVITLGTPALAARRMYLRKPSSSLAWFSTRFMALPIFAAAGVTHAAHQAVARGDFEFVGIEQVDGLQTYLYGVRTKFVERNFLVTPAGKRTGGYCPCALAERYPETRRRMGEKLSWLLREHS